MTAPGGDRPVESLVDAADTQPQPPNDVRDVLARDVAADEPGSERSVWIRAVSAEDDPAAASYRWSYPDLEALVALPEERRLDFADYLDDRDPVVATNAAIALARLGEIEGFTRLADAATNPKLQLPMRRAAVEALAALPEQRPEALVKTRGALESLLRKCGDPLATCPVELHAELIRGLGPLVDPAGHPLFHTALGSRSPEVRLETVRQWLFPRNPMPPLPNELIALRSDRDPRIRAAVFSAIGRCGHPLAGKYLQEGLADHDLNVRLAAVEALGRCGDAAAEALLTDLLETASERLQAAAVGALAEAGATQTLLDVAEHESWRVRREVARALAALPDRNGRRVAEQLLGDTSTEVRHAVVDAVAEWPLKTAGQILLEAMQAEGYLTRSMAAEQLIERWPAAREFPVDGPAERRAEVLADLRSEFRGKFGTFDPASLVEAAEERPRAEPTPEQLARVMAQIEGRDAAGMLEAGEALLPALETLALDNKQLLPDWVFAEVLAGVDPVFAELARLESEQLAERRRAAGRLVELAREKPLSRLAVARLHTLIIAESDQLLWQSALDAVAGNSGAQAGALACAGLGHLSPEVRRRACDHLAAHPNERYTKALLASLTERSPSVLAAVVRALGAIGQLDDTSALQPLLMSPHETVQLETARALYRLGDPTGRDALKRLAYSDNVELRQAVAETMGELSERAFAPELIGMLDDRMAVRRAALASLEAIVGEDGPAESGERPGRTNDRVERWRRWAEQQGIATRTR